MSENDGRSIFDAVIAQERELVLGGGADPNRPPHGRKERLGAHEGC
jgi:hypothetical protein